MFMKAVILISGIVVSIATLASSSALAQVQAVTIGAIPSLGGSIVGPTALNNAGQVVGYSTLPGDAQTHGFVCASGVTYDLGTLGGSYSQANAVNSHGQIVGDSVL